MAAAFPGEITGNGKPTAGPAHANSICIFSGQNDDQTAPLSLDRKIAPNGPGGVSQSFGQDVKLGLDPQVLTREQCGAACGHTGASPGYVANALRSKDGGHQIVVLVNPPSPLSPLP
jgi:hypothetical protein